MADPAPSQVEAILRPASLHDAPRIHKLISDYATRQVLLSRGLGELYENIRDFAILEEGELLVGCAALHIYNAQLSELKSLAVSPERQRRGYGRRLVEWCLAEARRVGLARIFCLTYQVEFFQALGFVRVDRSRLPEKVWGECVRCSKFFDCDEVALWREV